MYVLKGCRQKRHLVTISKVVTEEARTPYHVVVGYVRKSIVICLDRPGAPLLLGRVARHDIDI